MRPLPPPLGPGVQPCPAGGGRLGTGVCDAGVPTTRAARWWSERGLDGFVCALADVQTGVGPFLAVYLAARGWDPAHIGLALGLAGVSDIVLQVPAGAIIDRTRARRAWLSVSILAILVASLLVVVHPTRAGVYAANVLLGSTASLLGPGMAAVSLGLVGHAQLAARQARNRAWNSGGNIAAAVGMGLVGWWAGDRSVFLLTALMTVPTLLCLLAIRPQAIDDQLARGGAPRGTGPSVRVLLAHPAVRAVIIGGAALGFANAAMLTLIAQELAHGHPQGAPLAMGACLVVAQVVISAASPAIGRWADRIGRRPLVILGGAALTLRAGLCAFTTQSVALIALQVLDGVSAALLGVALVVVLADATRGSAHFNLVGGISGMIGGACAAAAQPIVGALAHRDGAATAFTLLALVAGAGTWWWVVWLPETRPGLRSDPASGRAPLPAPTR